MLESLHYLIPRVLAARSLLEFFWVEYQKHFLSRQVGVFRSLVYSILAFQCGHIYLFLHRRIFLGYDFGICHV